MPLHLLGKKSWNVYAPDNIARVKRDEAAALAYEEEQDRILQAYDAEKRLALLRGSTPPPAPILEPAKPSRRKDEERTIGRDRKRKRIAGEDDTDRDLRAAREDLEERHHAPLLEAVRAKRSDAPITDGKGHINLFPVDPREQHKTHKNAEVEAEKARKARELEDQYTMRLANAAGRDGLAQKPWYTSATPAAGGISTRDSAPLEEADTSRAVALYAEEKNAWGRPDPNRPSRDKARISASDPMQFMSQAQQQLKKAEGERRRWAEEREREMDRLRREGERRERRERKERKERRKRRRDEGNGEDDVGELEGFSLDGPGKDRRVESKERRHGRDRDEKHHSRRRERDRSRDRASRHRSSHGT
jgi:hypothetical protein